MVTICRADADKPGSTGTSRCAGADGVVQVWAVVQIDDLPHLRLHCTLRGHGDQVRAVAFSSDGAWLASGSKREVAA